MATFDVYTRVSDEGGRGGAAFGSPEEQEAAARAWIERVGGEVGDVVYEGNVSGATAAENRRLGELIGRIERGESSGIVVLYEDRFARDVIEGGRALQRIVDAGGRLIATATGFDSANLNPQSEMIFNVMMAIGQAQRKRNRDNYLNGKERAAARGVYCARAPFGYDRDEDGRLVPNGDAETVRQIYRWRSEGVGYAEITRRAGMATRGGPRNVICSRVYRGEQRIPDRTRKGEPKVIRDAHTPIVSEEEWQAANAVKGRTPIRRGLGALVKFKGLVVCGTCGRGMSINGYGPMRAKLTYICGTKRCGAAAHAAKTLEPLILEALDAALQGNEPHVAAVMADDDRYTRALAAVTEAQDALAAYRDSIELQQALGIADFAAGLRTRREALETTRRALRETPRPDALRDREVRPLDGDNLGAEFEAYRVAVAHRVIAEVRVYPRKAEHRVTLRWVGSETEFPVIAAADTEEAACVAV
jgi:DNA invertase Pin-like site-specific DNA recombinase